MLLLHSWLVHSLCKRKVLGSNPSKSYFLLFRKSRAKYFVLLFKILIIIFSQSYEKFKRNKKQKYILLLGKVYLALPFKKVDFF